MNAVKEIEAAHKKLTELRDGSALGPWEGWKQYISLRNVYGIEARGSEVAKTYSATETELIVALHRTIDAQLIILKYAQIMASGRGPAPFQFSTFGAALTLARSINGSTS